MESKKPDFNYDLVVGTCTRFLIIPLRERHLEDLIQYVSLKYWESGCRGNLVWMCIDYCRKNGIGKHAKLSAKTLECATFVGLGKDENEDQKENQFLFDQYAAEKDEPDAPTAEGILEEFLKDLNLKTETMRWVLKNYQYNPKIK